MQAAAATETLGSLALSVSGTTLPAIVAPDHSSVLQIELVARRRSLCPLAFH
jgi:hypothetical protein